MAVLAWKQMARTALRWFVVGMAAGTLALALTLALAEYRLQQGTRLAAAGALDDAAALYHQVARLAPLHPGPHHALAAASVDPVGADAHWQAAIRRDPVDAYLRAHRTQTLLDARRWSDAAAAAQEALRLRPMAANSYEVAITALTEHAVERYQAGDYAAGQAAVAQALAVDAQLRQAQARAEPHKQIWSGAMPKPRPVYDLGLGRALALSGDYAAAVPHLERAATVTAHKIQAEIWLYMALMQLGRADAAETLAGRPWVRALRINPLNGILGRASARRSG